MNINKFYLGAHLNTSEGFEQTFKNADQVGALVVQIFLKSNRSWQPPMLSSSKIKEFFLSKNSSNVKDVIGHASYLVNLASLETEIFDKSVKSLEQELTACDQLKIPFLVLHPGSSKGQPKPEAILRVAKALDTIYAKNNFSCKVLLETMAGQGSTLGSLEEIAQIRENCSLKNNIGYCVDTAHLFAYGHDFLTVPGLENLLNLLDQVLGLQNVGIVHVNDSVHGLGDKKDRHANIGAGKIGLEPLKRIVQHVRLAGALKVLETPQEPDFLIYQKEIAILVA